MEQSNKKTIYFVRHGESEGNVGGLRRGGDSPLTNHGFAQAKQIGNRLKNLPVDVIVSSDYVRAQQTAETISKVTGHESIVYSNLLVERRLPSSLNNTLTNDPAALNIVKTIGDHYGEPTWRYEDADTGGELAARANQALEFIIARPEQYIAVVTHCWFLRFMIARILVGDALTGQNLVTLLKTFRTNNTGITIVEYNPNFDYDSPWALRALNDHAHLADLIKELPEGEK